MMNLSQFARPPVDALRCHFCSQYRAPGETTVVGSARVCSDCLGAMETMFAAAPQTSGRHT
jgi:hypothetical protein